MALTKPPVLPPWAEAGDKVQPTNAEIQTGWPLSNTPPARQRWNWILNFLANGVRYLTRRGLPDYGADETYMVGDRVIGDDGKTYRSIQDNNLNHAPSASPLWWEEWAPSQSRLADLLQKQTYTAFTTAGAAPNFTLTPTPAITAYAAGQRFRVKAHATGTTGSNTLNVSVLGAKSLMQYDSIGTKVAGVVINGQIFDVEYDGVDFVILDALPQAIPSLFPVGGVVYVPQASAPSGFLKANGAAVSRTTYSALFAAIGTTFGAGDGATTFNLPDLRGEFVRGWDDSRGVDSGRGLGSFQDATALTRIPLYASNGAVALLSQQDDGEVTHSNMSNECTGPGSQASVAANRKMFKVRPRNVALLACIKY